MSAVGRLRVKDLSELNANFINRTPAKQSGEIVDLTIRDGNYTPYNDTSDRKEAALGNRKARKKSAGKTSTEPRKYKRLPKSLQKQPSPNQRRIDNFFSSLSKTCNTAKIDETDEEKSEDGVGNPQDIKSRNERNSRGKKRLFVDPPDVNTPATSTNSTAPALRKKENLRLSWNNAYLITDYIDLCSEPEEEKNTDNKESTYIDKALEHQKGILSEDSSDPPKCLIPNSKEILSENQRIKNDYKILSKSDERSSSLNKLNCKITETDQRVKPVSVKSGKNLKSIVKNTVVKKKRQCPSYKIVNGTHFAVDAFQFGLIDDVTHYFLTHFHADHYIGLTRKFSMPLILSPITAQLIRTFIPVDESFLHEIPLNETRIIDDVEVTAIDAHHCPGAVMFIFKLKSGKCILHTGDFRASPDMESEPVFWNNDIDLIYLDTTYISDKYAFCTQDESISRAQLLIEEFQAKHKDKRILYICGAYLIGKEKFWSAIARRNNLIIWTEHRRYEALKAMQDVDILTMLSESPAEANLHVINMGKLSYFTLVEYFESYSTSYDVCLAIRPSGWEKASKPQYRGKINIIGIEYSEHSSHDELKRFVTYLRPKEVISTVPVSRDLMITGKVPKKWYTYERFPFQHRNFQPLITSYLVTETKTMPINSNSSIQHEKEDNTKENYTPKQKKRSRTSKAKSPNQLLSLSLYVEHDEPDDDWLS